MRVAELLSDITSLRATSDTRAALALVALRPQNASQNQDVKEDPELQRVKDLIELHAKVKSTHNGGVGDELRHAREAVNALAHES